jgi:prevent-host-death family protein
MKERIKTRFPKAETAPAVLREAATGSIGWIVNVREAKAHLSALLDWVARGREVTITSDGEPKARLVPASEAPRKVFRGMGEFLLGQKVHRGPSAEELLREERDSRD